MAPGVRQNADPLSKGVHPGAGNNRQGCPQFWGDGALNQGRGTSHWADPQNHRGVLHPEGGDKSDPPSKECPNQTHLGKASPQNCGSVRNPDGWASPRSQGILIWETPSRAEPGMPFWNSSPPIRGESQIGFTSDKMVAVD